MRLMVAAVVVVVGCKHETKPPPAASNPEPGSAAAVTPTPTPAPAPAPVAAKPMTLAPGQKLGFGDFWEVGGLTRSDTPETVQQKWGPPQKIEHDDGTTLHYEAVHVGFRSDKSLQLDFNLFSDSDKAALAKYGGPQLALLGMTCDEAAKHLAFTDKADGYTTCKHYDKNGTLVDVTLMCTKIVDSLTVVWTPIPPDIEPIADHCGMPKD